MKKRQASFQNLEVRFFVFRKWVKNNIYGSFFFVSNKKRELRFYEITR